MARAWQGAYLALGLLSLASASPVRAADENDERAAPYRAVAALDARLQTTGWRLARANAPFCDHVAPAIGLLVQDLQSWAEPDEAREAFGVSDNTQVIVGAVAAGSPAAEAGLLPGQPLRTITDYILDIDLPPAAPGTYQRQTLLLDLIDRALLTNGWVALGFDGGTEGRQFVRIHGENVCASRFEIASDGKATLADGDRIVIEGQTAAQLDEAPFAFLVAHELAHNILAHRDWLDQHRRGWKNVRRTEREADRLAVWLLANAGYDPQGGVRLMREWVRRREGLFNTTHDAWDERAAAIRAEIALVAASSARPGEYDWSSRFSRVAETATAR